MLIESLQEFHNAYKKLWKEISDENEKINLINQTNVSKADASKVCCLLQELIIARIHQLPAFELMLHINKDEALYILKDWYLSMDLSEHVKDQVEDLEIMLSDVKDILGEEELKKILNCSEFLPKNKKNKRVKEAIRFALEDD
ncbi:hypothetical protein [Snodgrassella alvi]|uniref:hypothetical protein n=1 Tax=Snodgrassella alvi TaxID=1196083 RepID=UPI003461476B